MTTTKTCSFCVRGRCDIVIYKSWDELNSYCQYIHNEEVEYIPYEQRDHILSFSHNIVRAIGIHYCNTSHDDDVDVIVSKIISELKCAYEERKENIKNGENNNMIDCINNSWNHLVNMVTDVDDYKNYNEEIFSKQRTYLSNIQIDVVMSIGIQYCNGRKHDEISVIIEKIHSLLQINYQVSYEQHIIETRHNAWNHIVDMVTDVDDYTNYNEQLFTEQHKYLLTLPLDVVRSIGINHCNGTKDEEINFVIAKIFLELKCMYQKKAEEHIVEEHFIDSENAWNHIIDMVEMNDYMNYNEEMFSQQCAYLSSLNVDVIRVIGIAFCNGRINDEISVIIEKIHSKLMNVFQEMPTSFAPNWIVRPLLISETANELQKEMFCAICLDFHKKINSLITNCQHEFCKKCVCDYLDSEYLKNGNCVPTCAMCRTIITTLETKDVELYDELYERYTNKPPQPIDQMYDIYDMT